MFGRYDEKTFREQLEKNLSWLRRRILNLDDYVPREEVESLKNNLAVISRERDNLQAQCKDLKNYAASLDDELSTMKDYLLTAKDQVKKISDECNYYREAYADLDAVYKNYRALNGNIRYQLAGIFGDAETVQGFLIGAANEKHLSDFWDYLRYSLNDGRISADDAKILKEIFDFCFDALNHSSREPIFLRLNAQRGSRFDNRTMMRTSDSQQLGRVQNVLLAGYSDRVGNVIRPSLVFIAD